ncbi:hypothetical protein NDR87_30045 [Nocardia sp. CDC159]|uniref:Uncharacterized protein n=1 Tax=Nocardia pulmonis TaxID=2951408 RepID=A0A9X2EB88_9NOCA|nr:MULTISPECIES: hypothetical protein [Nocardia]MCM6777734.1 hypothetical protein [Nocardia pulmonis]MCM6790619.1 hypothetical protein [Nocardia sp. CDC159]
MISLWWSFTLTAIGVTGLFLVYRHPTSLLGPGIGLAVQLLWIAYAIHSRQWWFLASAAAYGSANVYGIHTRRRRTPTATGGTFTVWAGGRQSPPLPHTATRSEVDAAVAALLHPTDHPTDSTRGVAGIPGPLHLEQLRGLVARTWDWPATSTIEFTTGPGHSLMVHRQK